MLPDCTHLFIMVEPKKMPYAERKHWWENGYWVDAQLTKIPVAKMEDQHLLRVYQLIKKETERRLEEIHDNHFSSFAPQGEMANDLFEEMYEWAMDVTFEDIFYGHPFVPHLLEDVLRRGRAATWLTQFDLDAQKVDEFIGALRATYF